VGNTSVLGTEPRDIDREGSVTILTGAGGWLPEGAEGGFLVERACVSGTLVVLHSIQGEKDSTLVMPSRTVRVGPRICSEI
jgi:hypothetical protein